MQPFGICRLRSGALKHRDSSQGAPCLSTARADRDLSGYAVDGNMIDKAFNETRS